MFGKKMVKLLCQQPLVMNLLATVESLAAQSSAVGSSIRMAEPVEYNTGGKTSMETRPHGSMDRSYAAGPV